MPRLSKLKGDTLGPLAVLVGGVVFFPPDCESEEGAGVFGLFVFVIVRFLLCL